MASQNRRKRGRGRPFQKGNRTGRVFKPGQSGNPGGRPASTQEMRDLIREHTPRAIERLAKLMDSKDQSCARLAAESLLDRAGLKGYAAELEQPTPEEFERPTLPKDPETRARLLAEARRAAGLVPLGEPDAHAPGDDNDRPRAGQPVPHPAEGLDEVSRPFTAPRETTPAPARETLPSSPAYFSDGTPRPGW